MGTKDIRSSSNSNNGTGSGDNCSDRPVDGEAGLCHQRQRDPMMAKSCWLITG